MKLCKDCGRSIRRGWSGGITPHSVRCLVCATARLMATFRVTKKGT